MRELRVYIYMYYLLQIKSPCDDIKSFFGITLFYLARILERCSTVINTKWPNRLVRLHFKVDAPVGWFSGKNQLASARRISNIVFNQKKLTSSKNNALLMSFGQMFVHDTNFNPASDLKDFPGVKVKQQGQVKANKCASLD